MAQPSLVQKLCRLSQQIARSKPQPPVDPAFAYANSGEMVEATFDSLVRFKELLGHAQVPRPNFTHMVTHTEALLNLEAMGYAELARLGHAGQRTHISVEVPVLDPSQTTTKGPATLSAMMSADFWNEAENQRRWREKWNREENPNGDWIASGHLFKVLYSFHRLMPHVADQEKVRTCAAVLLERYMNPFVQGG